MTKELIDDDGFDMKMHQFLNFKDRPMKKPGDYVSHKE
jgi:hypothetical protein